MMAMGATTVMGAVTGRMNVEVVGVTQRFGRREVLRGVDLEVGRGVFGLLGPNGAGKTTLLRTLSTAIAPAGGSLRLLGYDPNFTVFEFVEYFALLKEMPVARVRPAVARAIERVELGDRARAKLKTLSGGMLRRVGIAQAIVNEPELLLLDEPTAGLDPEQRVAFRRLLREVGARGTVVVSTHLVEDVGAACAQVALMEGGRIVFRGTPGQLMARAGGDGAGADEAGDSPLERGYSAVLAGARS